MSEEGKRPDVEEEPAAGGDDAAGEEELTVGGTIEEEQPRQGRPIVNDLIAGGVLLLVIILGLYFFIGFGGEEPRERPEVQVAEEPLPEREEPVLRQPAPVEEWSPEEFRLPPPRQADDVSVALEHAQEALAAGRLIEPEGDNALESFRSVLETEPDNQAAQQGIEQIVDRLTAQAGTAMDEGRVREALERISAIRAIRPDAERLGELEARVEERREVIELLSTASSHLQEDRLVAPEDGNALTTYRRVLEIDPGNADAEQGILNVERRLLELATAAARDLEFQRAAEVLATAEGVREGPGEVEETRANIADFRQQTLERLEQQVRAAIAAADHEEAERLVAQVERVAPGSELATELSQEATRARVYAQFQPGDTFQEELAGGGQGPVLVVLPVGQFRMGSPENEPGHRSYEAPRHDVTLSSAVAMSRSEVTVGQFRRFVEATGQTTDAERSGSSTVYSENTGRMERRNNTYWIHDFHGDRADDDLPVIHVSWNDASAYAQWLAEQTGEPYRLPSEAEWEYAARGGTTSPYWWGSGSPDDRVENLTGEGDRSDSGRSWTRYFAGYRDNYWGPAPVASFQSNPFGLYDIMGNISEWVEDCWHDSYARAPADGTAWVNVGCERRVVRGGSWGSPPDRSRSAYRVSGSPDTHTVQVGFRVARNL